MTTKTYLEQGLDQQKNTSHEVLSQIQAPDRTVISSFRRSVSSTRSREPGDGLHVNSERNGRSTLADLS